MRQEDKLYPKWVAITGLIFCGAMAVSLPLATIITGIVIIIIGFVLRMIFRKMNGDDPAV